MLSLTRRNLLKGMAAAPVVLSLPLHAQTTTLVRHDLASELGLEMLTIYADAVRKMQAMGPENPMGWMWQWYTHFVDGTTSKTNEVTRIFGTTPSPLRTLAVEVWNTCQSHAGQNYNHFLPWHRMFVYYFERIVRQVSERPDFTLPYWDYTSDDPAKRGVVPVQFCSATDPVFDILYRPERTTLANTGQPIHSTQPTDVMDISDLMRRTAYSNVGSVQGFCRGIDSGIHGRIHVLVGNSRGMGSVPYAARDPLFWVHHSNIDRMWASWNRNGGKNPSRPTWGETYFVMTDANGVRIRRKLANFFSTLGLNYTYDSFIPRPAALTTAAATTSISSATVGTLALATTGDATGAEGTKPERVAKTKSPANLGAGPVGVALSRLPGTRQTSVLGLDPAQPGKRTYLVLKDLHAWAQPEVLYHVYLRPGNGSGKLDRSSYAGNINFFDAEFHDHGTGTLDEALGQNFYSFDVTDVLRRIGRSANAAARDTLLVTIVPAGTPRAAAKPVVATIELVRQ